MPLVTYGDAQPFAGMMMQKTGARLMPPWGAFSDPQCTPPLSWKNDPTLSQSQIDTIAAWANANAPEGDPKDAPPAMNPQPIALSNPSKELAAPAAYAIKDGGTDEFRCFVLDPNVTATTYVNGLFVEPGNKTIVHHVLVYTDPTRAAPAKVTDAATQSYPCFGSAGVPNQNLLAAWAPGTQPVDYPSNVGAVLDANTLLVMQIHYHPHSTKASLTPDQTKFQMRYSAQRPSLEAYTVLPGNYNKPVSNGTGLLPGPDDPPSGPAFVIPADAKGHTETMQVTMPATIGSFPLPDLPVLRIGGHMHYVGVAEQVTVHHAKVKTGVPQDQCLLNIPRWDFDWQRAYEFDAPIDQLPTLGAGDVVKIQCTYDNSLDNPKVVQSLTDQMLSQPQKVVLGETTLDEMCLAPVVLLAPNVH
jgi:hypothetical protein